MKRELCGCTLVFLNTVTFFMSLIQITVGFITSLKTLAYYFGISIILLGFVTFTVAILYFYPSTYYPKSKLVQTAVISISVSTGVEMISNVAYFMRIRNVKDLIDTAMNELETIVKSIHVFVVFALFAYYWRVLPQAMRTVPRLFEGRDTYDSETELESVG
ncbi:uncharacterized protein LOC115885107 [Sitophilus oryzae]|uniref:Uncharacterized protein LOC115885107 n=1 Tax=Sitophilus oryzae TaxID=7048 RepID=A0A6J2Y855_SITOR|nr:uncharacterized protein LOC115885107 [Sitophilus oryzae]